MNERQWREGKASKGIFQNYNLHYMGAWEVANPGDRVIGVGATQVGNQTQQYLEIDPEYLEQCSQLQVGIVGGDTHGHYRLPEMPKMKPPIHSEWMRERITTAMRVIENANQEIYILNHPICASTVQYRCLSKC